MELNLSALFLRLMKLFVCVYGEKQLLEVLCFLFLIDIEFRDFQDLSVELLMISINCVYSSIHISKQHQQTLNDV